jgi:hypothetical protein
MNGPQNTFTAFIDDILFCSTLIEAARTNHPLGHHCSPGYSQAILNLRARKLTETLGVPFAPTNNLAEHLEFDEGRWRIYIFHHAGFLKHQLQLTKGLSTDNDFWRSVSDSEWHRFSMFHVGGSIADTFDIQRRGSPWSCDRGSLVSPGRIVSS